MQENIYGLHKKAMNRSMNNHEFTNDVVSQMHNNTRQWCDIQIVVLSLGVIVSVLCMFVKSPETRDVYKRENRKK